MILNLIHLMVGSLSCSSVPSTVPDLWKVLRKHLLVECISESMTTGQKLRTRDYTYQFIP